jgi:outer membrane lipoprotein LolB
VTVAPPAITGGVPDVWTANGRMAINVAGEGGSGAFTWRQDGARSRLAIRGPLGVGALDVTVDGNDLSVTDGSGVTLSGEPARAQVQARLGADLPLASLRYWMTGVPDPATESDVRDSTEPPLRVIEQNGWRVAYDRFGQFTGLAAPTRLTATGANVRLKVVLEHWTVNPGGIPSGQ